MGLLDDAIREHLDLKRRRGADPAEVERAEREALGPVRRNRDPADTAPSEELESATQSPTAAERWPDDHELAEPAVESDAFDDDELDDDVSVPVAEAPPRRGLWSRMRGEPRDEEEPLAAAPPSSRQLSDMGAGETAEYHLHDELAHVDDEDDELEPEDEEVEDDDVLEETPEFLQDTPDHDRLWFEQRPPRDFDFDG